MKQNKTEENRRNLGEEQRREKRFSEEAQQRQRRKDREGKSHLLLE